MGNTESAFDSSQDYLSTNAIETVASLLDQLSSARQRPATHSTAVLIETGRVPADLIVQPGSVQSLLAEAKAEVFKLLPGCVAATKLMESVGRAVTHYCHPTYHPYRWGDVRDPAEVFDNGIDRVIQDGLWLMTAGRIRDALLGLLEGRTPDEAILYKHLPIDFYDGDDPATSYREVGDPMAVLDRLQRFRSPDIEVHDPVAWPHWTTRTEQPRMNAVRRLRGMQAGWLEDTRQAGVPVDRAEELYRQLLQLGEDIAQLPVVFPGVGALREARVALRQRYKDVENEMIPVTRRVRLYFRRNQPESRPVVLHGQGVPPSVLGEKVEPLPPGVYELIEALINAGPVGLKKDGLNKIASNGPRDLRRLVEKNSETWGKVIGLAGPEKKGYRIVHPGWSS